MSIDHVEKFYQMAIDNPELVSELHDATDPESFGSIAVRLGKENGCHFSVDEIGEWIKGKTEDRLALN